MRKSEREIREFDQIVDVLARCDTLHLGLAGEDGPYVVPVSFGFEVSDGALSVYFHGAREGMKHDLLSRDSRVCVEASLFHGYRAEGRSVTADYESVIGFGRAEKCEGALAAHGVNLLMEHCGFPGYDGAKCVALGITAVYRVTLERVTGKRRFSSER